MERRIETYIDNALESIAPQFYILNVMLGAALFLAGIAFLVWNVKKRSKKLNIVGIICLGIGILSISSVLLQLYGA